MKLVNLVPPEKKTQEKRLAVNILTRRFGYCRVSYKGRGRGREGERRGEKGGGNGREGEGRGREGEGRGERRISHAFDFARFSTIMKTKKQYKLKMK